MKLFFDTETTGLPDYKKLYDLSVQPHVLQLAALLTDDEGNTKGEFNTLIKPAGWFISAEAQKIHGISHEDCEKYGIEIRSALGMFNLWLKLKPTIVAHNLAFDEKLISFEVKRLGKESIFTGLEQFCTMQSSTNLVKIPSPRGYKWPKLQETHKFLFGSEFEGAHDAMADVKACARCFFELQKFASLTKESDVLQEVPK